VSDTYLLNVAVNVPLSREFDYLPPSGQPLPGTGCRVRVPFGRREEVGLVLAQAGESALGSEKIRRCLDVLDSTPLFSAADLWLLRFTSNYYHHPIGEVMAAALPAVLRQGKPLHPTVDVIIATDQGKQTDLGTLRKRAPRQAELLLATIEAGEGGLETAALNARLPTWRRAFKALVDKACVTQTAVRAAPFDEQLTSTASAGPPLNHDQLAALESLRTSDRFRVSLLDGVTGSGKTEVYLQRMQDVIERGQQVLVLVPEIGLTPQLLARLRDRLGIEPALLHSGRSDVQRLAAWQAARSGAARLVIGTRSAVFTPFRKLGLIVVDEEHDHSFKQQEGLRYSARDLAIAIAKHRDIPIILGSATPTLEMLQHCRDGAYDHLVLPTRAGGAEPPRIRLIDTVRTPTTDGVSEPLARAIDKHLSDNGQVLIYLNRRGFAPTLICTQCGYVAECDRCDARLTMHAASQQLRCHHCGAGRSLDSSCRQCSESVRPLGEGTERLEESLRTRFQDTVIRRIDSDSTQRKGAMDEALRSAADGDASILVGTQMLSKGHHFPKLTLVGIVNADQGLFGTDFRSSERMAQSVIQVAGRAGREQRRGEVLIQTAFPDHIFWSTLIAGGYGRISAQSLLEREKARWPPFTRLALLRSSAHQQADAMRFLESARQRLQPQASTSFRILGPVAAPMARKAGRYRAQLLLQSSDRATLHRLLAWLRPLLEADPAARKVRWSIDVDPIELF